jgi:hypothetical protein
MGDLTIRPFDGGVGGLAGTVFIEGLATAKYVSDASRWMAGVEKRRVGRMARYENLPIYRKDVELTIYLETVVRNFSRYNKYTLSTLPSEMNPQDNGGTAR